MGDQARSKLPWLAALAAAALAAIAVIVTMRAPPAESAGGAQARSDGDDSGFSARARPDLAAGDRASSDGEPGSGPDKDTGSEIGNEYPVDLERLRARIPDNLYWRFGAPTADPLLLQARAEEEKQWNQLFGKVQSGTGTEEDIRRYYDHRRQLSEDYIEFARLVLAEHAGELPERDRGLYELTIRMHETRLAEIPRRIEEALARKQEQDRRREEWRSGR